MNEPVDSKFPGTEPQELTGQEVWGSLLKLEEDQEALAPNQQRALALRKVSLTAINALSKLINNPPIKPDAITEAETVASYWDSLLKLQDMGIEANMKTNQPVEFYRDPLNAAEYAAGQLLTAQKDNLPSIRKVILEAEEHSEGNESTNKNVLQYKISADMLSTNMLNFAVLNTKINLLRFMLATEPTSNLQSSGNLLGK